MTTTYRPGTLEDMRPVFDMFRESMTDLLIRNGWAAEKTWWQTPGAVDWTWSTWQDLLAFLTTHAETQRIALAYSIQMVDSVPIDPHDAPVHAILTEDGFVDIQD